VDIYRRPEADHKFSYLVVPEGRTIPEEATNTDWESEARAVDIGENAEHLDRYAISRPDKQIAEKGYAITSVQEAPDGVESQG
jgi:hypothetical protein